MNFNGMLRQCGVLAALSSCPIAGYSQTPARLGSVSLHKAQEEWGQAEDELKEHQANKLQNYLDRISEEGRVQQSTVVLAGNAWNAINELSVTLPVPDAALGPDGEIMYVWDKAEHHFELEIYPEGIGEFFYRNRTSGQIWDAEWRIGEDIPEEAKEKLQIFI